jgi:hypothetical protein
LPKYVIAVLSSGRRLAGFPSQNSITRNTKMPSQAPIAPTSKRTHKTWWYAVSAIALIGVLFAAGGGSTNMGLDVTRSDWLMRGDGRALKVVNSGTTPIIINKLSVNGREDCKLFSLLPNKEASELLPYELKVGDQFRLNSSCQLIRVEISTKDGSATYEFGG